MDSDSYPTEETLLKIEKWEVKDSGDSLALFEFIEQIWWMPDWGFSHTLRVNKIHLFNLSTGGWSGNEDIIYSMRKNFIFWSMTWRVHRAGGHYEFEIEELNFKDKNE